MRYSYFILILAVAILPRSVFALQYIYPVDTWNITTQQGEDLGNGTYHMGVDAGGELSAGTPVYAVADGIVKEARTRTSFGMVVLIEHTLSDNSKIVSLYGHLDPADVPVHPGAVVHIGDRIGSLGNSSVNGGWPVHIHFGVHKEPYSTDWKYWGHVRDINMQDKWFEPDTFIATQAAEDVWEPVIESSLQNETTFGREITFQLRVGDIGSRVDTVRYKIKSPNTTEWTTLLTTSRFSGWHDISLPIDNLNDGDYDVQIIVKDESGLKSIETYRIHKDEANLTSKGFVSISANKDNGKVSLWSKTAQSKESATIQLQSGWRGSNDIAIAGRSRGTTYIVARGTSTRASKVIGFNEAGTKLFSFEPFSSSGVVRVAAGALDAGNYDEFVVSSPPGVPTSIKAYDQNLDELWEAHPFGPNHTVGADVVIGDVDSRSVGNEVVVASRQGFSNAVAILSSSGQVLSSFKGIGRGKKSGLNVAIGNVHPNAGNEIILGTEANVAGKFRIYSATGEPLTETVQPFGDAIVSVDVTTIHWGDEDPSDATVVSQANKGQAWAKTYWYSGAIEYTKLLYSESHNGGARIAREL